MKRIVAKTQGFMYLVSVTGVTGARGQVSDKVESLVQMIKSETDQSVCVGFGVSSAEQAALIKSWGADGVIVGSALVKCLGNSNSPSEGVAKMMELATELRTALD
jgi:tryptophan synthase alpha chain